MDSASSAAVNRSTDQAGPGLTPAAEPGVPPAAPPAAPPPAARALARAMQTVQTMVGKGGCAWHEEQTHDSLTRYLVEETAEFIDAIERELPAAEVSSELGDVLYQVLFHAALAERDGEGYSLESVADQLNKKLMARHPHVFGDRGYMSVEELNNEWERLKEDAAGEERGTRGPLDGIPAGMPTLARAAKVVDRLGRAGMINTSAHERFPEDPFAAVIGPDEQRLAEFGIGDAMLALVTRANSAGVDPDRALRLAVDRLAARVMHAEEHSD